MTRTDEIRDTLKTNPDWGVYAGALSRSGVEVLLAEVDRLTAELVAAKTHITPEARMAYDFQCRDNARLQGELHAARKELEAAKRDMTTMLRDGGSGCDICDGLKCNDCTHYIFDDHPAYSDFIWRGPCAENGGTP